MHAGASIASLNAFGRASSDKDLLRVIHELRVPRLAIIAVQELDHVQGKLEKDDQFHMIGSGWYVLRHYSDGGWAYGIAIRKRWLSQVKGLELESRSFRLDLKQGADGLSCMSYVVSHISPIDNNYETDLQEAVVLLRSRPNHASCEWLGDFNIDRNKPNSKKWKTLLQAASQLQLSTGTVEFMDEPCNVSRVPVGNQRAKASWIDHAFVGGGSEGKTCYQWSGAPGDHCCLYRQIPLYENDEKETQTPISANCQGGSKRSNR